MYMKGSVCYIQSQRRAQARFSTFENLAWEIFSKVTVCVCVCEYIYTHTKRDPVCVCVYIHTYTHTYSQQ